MLSGKKHKAEIERLESQIIEAKSITASETTKQVSNSGVKITDALCKSLTDLNFCLDTGPEEHKFIADFINTLPQMVQYSAYLETGLESEIAEIPVVSLSKAQRDFFSAEYDLRVSPHDGEDHLDNISKGNVDSTTALFNKVMQRYIKNSCGDRLREYHDKQTQANGAYDILEEFINQVSIDPNNRFACIEGGSDNDREALVNKYIAKSKKHCGKITGYVKTGHGISTIQPCEVMRDLEDKDVLFVADPNSIENLSELIEDIGNAETHVLVVLADAYDLKERDVQLFRINKEDEGIFDIWRYL